jgi:hypothetical protein
MSCLSIPGCADLTSRGGMSIIFAPPTRRLWSRAAYTRLLGAGRALNSLFISPELSRIFRFRAHAMRFRFPGAFGGEHP